MCRARGPHWTTCSRSAPAPAPTRPRACDSLSRRTTDRDGAPLMALLTLVRPSCYQDSVALLALARELRARPDVAEAAALMGTPANRELLAQVGLLTAEAA